MVFVLFSFLTLFVVQVFAVPLYEDGFEVTDVSIGYDETPEAPYSQGMVFIGDMAFDPHRNAIKNSNQLWTNGVVPYVFGNGITSERKAVIEMAMREIENDVNPRGGKCVKFQPRNGETNYVNIHVGTGCHSNIGNIHRGAQEVSLGRGCEPKGTAMHELLHSLGFFHEQNRFDRDNYINVDYSNIPANHNVDFSKIPSSVMTTLGTTYDFTSIMQYGPYSFAINRALPTMTPKSAYKHTKQMGQRLQLSTEDVLRIQKLYGCTQDTSHIKAKNAVNDLVACNFDSGLCGMKNTHGTTNWAVKSGKSSSGPQAGNTNGVDPYLLVPAKGNHNKKANIQTPAYNKGSTCLDFFIFQKGPSSYINLVLTGSRIRDTTIRSFRGAYNNRWMHVKLNLKANPGVSYHVNFEGHVGSEDLGLDDINVYGGKCL